MYRLKSIKGVVNNGLCACCGTCAGICPNNAIKMFNSDGLLLPQVNDEACTDCGLCLACCPGDSVDFSAFEKSLFTNQSIDPDLGRTLQCYWGHSTNDAIRCESSSGGVATQLLVFALEKGLIDGVVVIGSRSGSSLEFKPYIARTSEEIMSASTSKYCPTAVGQALQQILKEKGRFAVVGLPCQIHGVRKAEKAVAALKKRIVLHIGLFCSHTVNFQGTETLLSKFSQSPMTVKTITYRGKGWPGSMTITTKKGSTITIPYTGGWKIYGPLFSSFFFTPRRCLMCPDETNELADLSLGDAWLPELRKQRKGESLVIARTETGEQMLQRACAAGVISLFPLNRDKAKATQAAPLKFKKQDFETRLAMLRKGGAKVPRFNPRPEGSRSLFSYVRNLLVLFNVERSEKGTFKTILVGVPFQVLRLYYGIYKVLCVA